MTKHTTTATTNGTKTTSTVAPSHLPDRSEVWEWVRNDVIEMASEAAKILNLTEVGGEATDANDRIQATLGHVLVIMKGLEDEEREFYEAGDDLPHVASGRTPRYLRAHPRYEVVVRFILEEAAALFQCVRGLECYAMPRGAEQVARIRKVVDRARTALAEIAVDCGDLREIAREGSAKETA